MKKRLFMVFVLTISLALLIGVILTLGAAAQSAGSPVAASHDGLSVPRPVEWQSLQDDRNMPESSASSLTFADARMRIAKANTLNATAVAISGTLAYAGFDSRLLVLDISDPVAPGLVAEMVLTPNDIRDITLQGDYLYVASNNGGLRIISVSTPTSPVEVGYTTAITPVRSVAVSGDYAYVAGGNLGVVSVTNPVSPTLVGTYDVQRGWSYNVDVQGNHAYLTQNSLMVISVTMPTSPALVGSVSTFMPYYVDVAGDYAYLADYLEGLQVISVTIPTSPTIMGSVSTGSYDTRVVVSGTHAYVCASHYSLDGTGYLHIISVANPTAPTLLGTLFLPGGCRNLALADQYAYVANSNGLRVVSISDPQHPVEVGSYPTPPDSVVINGLTAGVVNTAYTFTATVNPPTVTTPITYVWRATGQSPVTNTGELTNTVAFTWSTPALQAITITAANAGGIVTDTHTILISTHPQTYTVYLPAVFKSYGVCSTIPTLISPANGSNLNALVPLFRWDNHNNPNATASHLEVAKDPDFTVGAWSLWSSRATGVKEFRFSGNLDPATTYYWRAWLMCRETDGPYSDVWSFTTGFGGTILPAPTLIAPANGSTLTATQVTLQWSVVDGAVEYLVHWREVGWGGYNYQWVSDTQTTISWLSANTTYEWWISARNDYAIGTDSETWQFITPAGSSSASPQNLNHSFVIEDDDTRIIFEGQDNK